MLFIKSFLDIVGKNLLDAIENELIKNTPEITSEVIKQTELLISKLQNSISDKKSEVQK